MKHALGPEHVPPPDELDLERLAALLGECAVGHTLDYHRTIASVMPRAHELADLRATRAGAIVICEEQSAGRGRAARQWHAAYASSLLVACILKPPLVPHNPAQIPMAAGIAVVHALIETAPALTDHVWLKCLTTSFSARPVRSRQSRRHSRRSGLRRRRTRPRRAGHRRQRQPDASRTPRWTIWRCRPPAAPVSRQGHRPHRAARRALPKPGDTVRLRPRPR